VTVTAKVL